MKEKVYDLVRLHEAMQQKLNTASYSEQIQILTLVSDKWSRMYCPEFLMSLNTLFELHMKSKKEGGVLAKPASKTGKTITTETLHLKTNFYEDDSFSRWVPEKKECVSVSKGVHKQNPCSLQKSL